MQARGSITENTSVTRVSHLLALSKPIHNHKGVACCNRAFGGWQFVVEQPVGASAGQRATEKGYKTETKLGMNQTLLKDEWQAYRGSKIALTPCVQGLTSGSTASEFA
jgi:hypothetical protein